MIAAIASALLSPSSGPELTSVAVARRGLAGLRRVRAAGVHDDADRQPERAGEVQVALVVRGHGHDRAGAVVGQHVVGRPDRDPLAVDRVDRVPAQEHAGLLAVGRPAARCRSACAPGSGRRPARRAARARTARRPARESAATTKNVAPYSVSGRVVNTVTGSARPSIAKLTSAPSLRPIQLRCISRTALGPLAFQRRHVVQQPVGVLSDLEVPLGQRPPDDLGAAALAVAVDDLLVGQHGLVVRAPVDVAVACGRPGRARSSRRNSHWVQR